MLGKGIALSMAVALWIMPGVALAQDAAAGEAVFQRCTGCHSIGEDAEHRMGPALNGVLGRTAGTAEGYNYSAAMVAAGAAGLVWTHATLRQFLLAPRAYVEGTKMSFPGLRSSAEIENLLAYLERYSPDYQVPTAGD